MKKIIISAICSILVACGGGGGGGSSDTAPPAPKLQPIKVLQSSYENKAASFTAAGPTALPAETANGNATAMADFFQDGSYSLVTHSLVYDSNDLSTSNRVGQIHFWKLVGATWVDNTSKLLSITTGCLHPRKAVVADFNGDGKPDVFFACHGFDAAPFAGENPHIVLSQPDGTYRNTTLPVTCYCHGASAVDVGNTGYADILVTDTSVLHTPFVLANNRNGTFAVDTNRLPATLANAEIYSAEIIDFNKDGKYDVWFGGNEPSFASTIYYADANNTYSASNVKVLPTIPNSIPLDIEFKNNNMFLVRTNTTVPAYTTAEVQKIDYTSLVSSSVYTHSGNYQNGNQWVNWIGVYQNMIVSTNSQYSISLSAQ